MRWSWPRRHAVPREALVRFGAQRVLVARQGWQRDFGHKIGRQHVSEAPEVDLSSLFEKLEPARMKPNSTIFTASFMYGARGLLLLLVKVQEGVDWQLPHESH